MFTTTRYILLTAIRDWLFIALFIAMLFALGISSFLGTTALSEQQQMVISYSAGATRIILLIGLIVFVCFHVRRAFENREVELILSRPISRYTFVFSYWLGFAVLSLMIIIPMVLAIQIFTKTNFYGMLYWSFSIIMEAFIVVAFSLFISLILRSAVGSVLASFAFYFICRMMGFFLVMIGNMYSNITELRWYMSKALYFISIFIPRFDLYGQSKWLIYGAAGDGNLWVFILQSLIFIPFLLLMAFSDFRRKQF